MLNNMLKSISFIAVLSIVLFTAGTLNAQDKPDSCSMHKEGMMHKSGDHKMMDKSDDHKMMNHEMKEDSMNNHSGTMNEQKSIVHEGAIDLSAIDENGDGKVYQDQMCWNVVSDESGECPQCGMKLKEVSLEKAKINLEENGFEVK
jgi:hypothetical protein